MTYRLRMMDPKEMRDLLQWLQRLAIPKARKGILYFLEVTDPEQPAFIDFTMCGCDPGVNAVDFLSGILTRYILGHWIYHFIKEELRRAHGYLNSEEIQYLQERIYTEALQVRTQRSSSWASFTLESGWLADFEQQLKRMITDVLSSSADELHLDGLLRFRFANHLAELREFMHFAVDDYLLSREYEDYVDLLRYFLETTPISPIVVHVVTVGEAARAFTDDYAPFDVSDVREVATRTAAEELHPQDVLMSALIMRSPRKVVLHTDDVEFGFAKTLVRVFGERLTVCDSCPECDVFVAAIDKGSPSVYTSI